MYFSITFAIPKTKNFTPVSIYLESFSKRGVRLVANSSLTEITKYPGQHNLEEEVEEAKQNKKNASKTDINSKEKPFSDLLMKKIPLFFTFLERLLIILEYFFRLTSKKLAKSSKFSTGLSKKLYPILRQH